MEAQFINRHHKHQPKGNHCSSSVVKHIKAPVDIGWSLVLPATISTERLEMLNDKEHILGIKIVGGDHRLKNYSSVITVHPENLWETRNLSY